MMWDDGAYRAAWLLTCVTLLAACQNSNPAFGIACGATKCEVGQVCCVDCDGQGRCGPPGSVCAGLACQGADGGQTSRDGGGDGGTGGKVCCIDCDGNKTCGFPPFECPGYACIDGEPCGDTTCVVGERCCEHCGVPFCSAETTCPQSAAPCATDRCEAFEGCVKVCQAGQCDCQCRACTPMDTQPLRPAQCELASRFVWNGTRCVEFDACSCEGQDCEGLFQTPEPCLRAYAHCGATAATTLPCGPSACNAEWMYCMTVASGTPNGTDTFSCVELPRACLDMADPDCSCFGEVSPFGCREQPEDAFTLSGAAP